MRARLLLFAALLSALAAGVAANPRVKPGIDGEQLAARLSQHATAGVVIRPIRFQLFYATHQGQLCRGVQLHVDPRRADSLVEWNYRILQALHAPKPLAEAPRPQAMLDNVNGGDEMRTALQAGDDIAAVLERWRAYAAQFRQTRQRWLL